MYIAYTEETKYEKNYYAYCNILCDIFLIVHDSVKNGLCMLSIKNLIISYYPVLFLSWKNMFIISFQIIK
jgi:hypothetical protein